MNYLKTFEGVDSKAVLTKTIGKDGLEYVKFDDIKDRLEVAEKAEMAKQKNHRVYKPQPVYRVIKKARTLQLKQLIQSGESKAACLEAVVAKCDDIYPDKLRFEMDFRAERERLTDSKRFCRECEAKGLVPENVADHTVFEGKTVVEKVLKEGLQVLGDKAQMFNCPLWKDSKNLFSQIGDQPQNAPVVEANVNEPADE